MYRVVSIALCLCLTLLAPGGCANRGSPANSQGQAERHSAADSGKRPRLSAADDALLEDLSRRSFLFFWEQADATTGIVRDRSRTDGSPVEGNARDVGSIASVGFGLTGLCIAADRGWVPRTAAVDRARTTLRFFAERMEQQRGWFYHFINLRTGAREWASELSSIDTALLLAGVLTVGQCFAAEPGIGPLAQTIYRRVDFNVDARRGPAAPVARMEAGDRIPEGALGSLLRADDPVPAGDRIADARDWRRVVAGLATSDGHLRDLLVRRRAAAPLRASVRCTPGWISAGGGNASRRTRIGGRTRWRPPARTETFCLRLAREFPGYSEHIWGVTASDSRKGYVAWGGPPRRPEHRRHGRARRRRGLADADAGYHPARRARDAPPVRRSDLRTVRVRRRVPPHATDGSTPT